MADVFERKRRLRKGAQTLDQGENGQKRNSLCPNTNGGGRYPNTYKVGLKFEEVQRLPEGRDRLLSRRTSVGKGLEEVKGRNAGSQLGPAVPQGTGFAAPSLV